MEPVRRCPDPGHGFFAGATCPACDRAGECLLNADRRERLSKFLSGALRHFPDDVGLTLDGAGWTAFDALVDAASGNYDWAGESAVEGVVATDPKGRFERRDGRIRAAYGHSVEVELGGDPIDGDAPDRLYHGTAPSNVEAIEREGLRSMDRQEVHLSPSVAAAREVGRRHAADPVVFVVDAGVMRADGCRVSKRGKSTYTTDRVPSRYLCPLDEAGGSPDQGR